MPEYRRNRVPGGTYFFTVNLHDRGSDLLVRKIAEFRQAVRAVRRVQPFNIDAWVMLPDHLHCMWTLPEADFDFPGRWQAIKIQFSKSLRPDEQRQENGRRRRELGVWQRRYWEHTIRDETDYRTHFDYIHFNPVKHGLVSEVSAWPYSTFHRCVERGLYPDDWSRSVTAVGDAGER